MDGTTLSTVASAVLSLGFSYIPKLKDWYDKLGQGADGSDDGGTKKRLVMLVLLVLVVLVSFRSFMRRPGAGFELNVTCDQPGAIGLVKSLVFAIAANQGTYMVTRRREDRRRRENERRENRISVRIEATVEKTKRGAAGNFNALKHGFYSRSFKDMENSDLEAIVAQELESEIAMLLVVVRRRSICPLRRIQFNPPIPRGRERNGPGARCQAKPGTAIQVMNRPGRPVSGWAGCRKSRPCFGSVITKLAQLSWRR